MAMASFFPGASLLDGGYEIFRGLPLRRDRPQGGVTPALSRSCQTSAASLAEPGGGDLPADY